MRARRFLLCAVSMACLSVSATLHAQEAKPSGAAEDGADAASQDTASSTSAGNDEIVVTGTFVRSQTQVASPVTVTSAADLTKQAAFTPGALINNLSINSGSQNNTDGASQTFTAGTTNVNLRGLGVSSTLVLLNGQRQVASAGANLEGDQFVDLSSLLPSIAIKRVEVLKDGASSLYGSDAVAGVVNFISHTTYNGAMLRANDQMTMRDGQNEYQIEGLAGVDHGPLHLVAAASFLSRDYLAAAARRGDFSKRASFSNFGNPQTFLVRGVPTPDPSCRAVAATTPNVIAPAGATGFCQFDFGDYFALVAAEKRFLGYGRATYDISDGLSAFAQVNYSHNKSHSTGAASQPILSAPLLPANNPGNRFGIPVVLIGRPAGTQSPMQDIDSTSETLRFAAGFKGETGAGLTYDATYVHARNDYSLFTVDTILDRYVAALNGVGGPNNNQFFNPLYGAANDPAVVANFTGLYGFDARSKIDTFDAHVSTTLFELPAGALGVAAGYQHRRESLTYDYNDLANANRLAFYIGNKDFSAQQTVNAAFVEINAPLFKGVELQAALRYEDFGKGVNTWDPKVGLLIRPAPGIGLRATYGTSFRAPSLFQRSGALVVPSRVFDPIAKAQVTVSQRTAADPASPLVPQTSTAYNLGATWESPSGLSLSVDYWNFAYKNYITAQSAAAVVAAAPNGPQVTRTGGNQIASVVTFFQNAGSLDTDGIDLQARLRLPDIGAGQFALSATGTRVLNYDLTDPRLGKIDGLGNRNYNNFGVPMPKLRGNVGLEWKGGIHSANVFVRYIDSYRDDSDANYLIKSFTTVDAQYSFTVPPERFGGMEPTFAVGFRNLFDKSAPDALDRSGYDPLVANPLGRLFYTSFAVKF